MTFRNKLTRMLKPIAYLTILTLCLWCTACQRESTKRLETPTQPEQEPLIAMTINDIELDEEMSLLHFTLTSNHEEALTIATPHGWQAIIQIESPEGVLIGSSVQPDYAGPPSFELIPNAELKDSYSFAVYSSEDGRYECRMLIEKSVLNLLDPSDTPIEPPTRILSNSFYLTVEDQEIVAASLSETDLTPTTP